MEAEPAFADASRSRVLLDTISDGTIKLVTGVKKSFKIEAKDCFGEPATRGFEKFHAEIAPADGQATGSVCHVHYRGDGNYTGEFTAPKEGGRYEARVTLEGQNIQNSPFDVIVTVDLELPDVPGTAACSHCSNQFLESKVSEHEAVCEFRIVQCPKCGKSMPAHQLEEHMLAGCDGDAETACVACGETMLSSELEAHNPVCPMRSTTCARCGQEVKGWEEEMHPMFCSAAPAKAEDCTAHGKGLEEATVGVAAEFRVFATMGKVIADDIHVEARMVGSDDAPMTVEGTVRDCMEEEGEGCVASWIPTHVGDWEVDVLVGGERISESPFTVEAEPAFADASKSSVILDEAREGKLKVVAGLKGSFHIEAKDCFGNPATRGFEKFHAEVVAVGGQDTLPVQCKIHYRGAGVYAAECIPRKEAGGRYEGRVSFQGQSIHGSPFPVVVTSISDLDLESPSGTAKCALCSMVLSEVRLSEHEAVCDFRTVQCDRCGEKMTAIRLYRDFPARSVVGQPADLGLAV